MCGAAQSAVSVSDEGLLHALWSVSYRAAERAPLVQLGADALTALAAGVRWVVVRVSTEQQIASGWLLAREGAPNRLAIDIKTRGTAAIDDACAAADVVDRTIERLIANRACFQVVDVVNTPSISPAAAVRAVAESVRAEFVARVANPKEAVARRNDRAGE